MRYCVVEFGFGLRLELGLWFGSTSHSRPYCHLSPYFHTHRLPEVSDDTDLRNFDPTFVNEPVPNSVVAGGCDTDGHSMRLVGLVEAAPNRDPNPFTGFSFVGSNALVQVYIPHPPPPSPHPCCLLLHPNPIRIPGVIIK